MGSGFSGLSGHTSDRQDGLSTAAFRHVRAETVPSESLEEGLSLNPKP